MTIELVQLRGGVKFPTGGEAAYCADKPASRESGRNGFNPLPTVIERIFDSL